MLTIFPIPAFSDNYIWCLHRSDDDYCAIVDPGDAKPVMHTLERMGLKLHSILITHHHHDHTGGIAELVKKYQPEVVGPKKSQIAHLTHKVVEGDQIYLSFLDTTFNVLEIPGHTLDHIAYVSDKLVFCGDTLFSSGCGRLFEGTPSQMVLSLTKIAQLPPNTLLYCAHEYTQANLKFAEAVEPNNEAIQSRIREVAAMRADNKPSLPSTLESELRTNPFLRCDQTDVINAASAWCGETLREHVDVFAALRRWKDGF
ncbi:MAG: hydroxyacylglutathione hydrolase [Gammaproteobacteria bacterium]